MTGPQTGKAGRRERHPRGEGRVRTRLPFVALLLLGLLLDPSPLWAQSCALCKTALVGQAAQTVQSLNLGILILLVPPLTIFSAIFVVALRRDK